MISACLICSSSAFANISNPIVIKQRALDVFVILLLVVIPSVLPLQPISPYTNGILEGSAVKIDTARETAEGAGDDPEPKLDDATEVEDTVERPPTGEKPMWRGGCGSDCMGEQMCAFESNFPPLRACLGAIQAWTNVPPPPSLNPLISTV